MVGLVPSVDANRDLPVGSENEGSLRTGIWGILFNLRTFFVFVGYYLGARLGFALTFQPHPVSVMWPPNSLLLAALLLSPSRVWPVLLLAAFPAHILAEWQSGVPFRMVLCWFVSNSFEAFIGAASARILIGQSVRFESHRTPDQNPCAGGADECFERIADEPTQNHSKRKAALPFRKNVRRKSGQQQTRPA